jgi:hypothetical protein
MAQAGFTPIRLYSSTTASAVPLNTNLATGELAINITDGKLYYKDNTNTVKLLADASAASGSLPGGGVGTVVYQSATGVTAYLTLGTNGYLLTAGATAPQYSNPATFTVGTATNATNLAGGTANQIVYQSGVGVSAFAPAPSTAGLVLGWTGTAFTWVTAPAASTATSLAGGAQYQIPFQSGVGVTVFNSNLTFDSSTNTFGTTNITTTGVITAPQVGNMIPFYYANQAAFPSAATSHGAWAHSHADGAMYFAHGGSWIRALDASTPVTAAQGGTGITSTGTAGNILTSTGSAWISAAAPVTGPSIAKTYYMAQF